MPKQQTAHAPSPARARQQPGPLTSPVRVRPSSATRRRNVQSPSVTKRTAGVSQPTPLHAPLTPRAPAAVHSRVSPLRNADNRVELNSETSVASSGTIDRPATVSQNVAEPCLSDPKEEEVEISFNAKDAISENDISLTWKDIYSPLGNTPTTIPQNDETSGFLDASAVVELEFIDDADDDAGNDINGVDTSEGNGNKSCAPKAGTTPIKIRHTKKSSTSIKTATHERSVVTNGPDSMYPDGRTAAEVAQTFTSSMRHYNGGHDGPPKSANKRGSVAVTPAKSTKKGASATPDTEGRPSLGTLTMQWQFMRDNFLKGNEEELEWLMVSKNAGAYKHAHKKYCAAEDKYYRSLCETEVIENKMTVALTEGRKLQAAMTNGAAIYLSLQSNPGSEEQMNQAVMMQNVVKSLFALNGGPDVGSDAAVPTLMNCFCANTQKILKQLMEESNRVRIARIANSVEKLITEELKDIPSKLMATRKDGDDALKDMEKWSKREVETNDYAEAMKSQEAEWFQKEFAANTAAYRTMREFVPIGITEMTVDVLQRKVCELSGLYSLELIQEMKKNKLLHWIVTHTEDIATSNFLVGESKQYFENIEGYDIIELRALCMCLPEKFDLDGDGKKADWRSRLLNRTKLLASQQNREQVKGAWDFSANKRSMVSLPPLKPDQERRAVYYHRTRQQNNQRLKQYDEKETLLEKKKGKTSKNRDYCARSDWLVCVVLLAAAEVEYLDTKKEYDTLLVEMRDPEFKAVYGTEKVQYCSQLLRLHNRCVPTYSY
jgi:hypothetical protein